MKRHLLILTFFLVSKTLLAEHITGGEMYYTFLGISNGNYQYHITLKLYRDCNSPGAQLDNAAAIGIFNKSTNVLVWNEQITRTRIEVLQLTTPGPCISNAPVVCYQVGYYEFDVSLPPTTNGYTVAYQRCCRINGINNLQNSSNTGATYTADIPGTGSLADAPANNSAKFTGVDTVIVCGGYPFTYSFGAVDADRDDELRYSFCEAYIGGSSGNGNASQPNPPANPPYFSVDYSTTYNSGTPLGGNVTIDPFTGLITGTAPSNGIYVVTVCVQEIRRGVVIATQRKDLQIKAGDCDIAKPRLEPKYITCDGLSYTFTHPSNPLINTYYWEFGDPASGNNTSADQNPTHAFSAAGSYLIKLVTNRNQDCSDSATAQVEVWPGFFPAFTSSGVCITNPVLFTDGTTTNYGVVDSWKWDFGDVGALDVSSVKNPAYTYLTTGTKDVRLIVTNSKGCIDTLNKPVLVIDKPPITLGFIDTLICVPDAVQLQASGTGNFSWTPLTSILNANTGTPTVTPTTTTEYTVHLDLQGCVNEEKVTVRVVRFVTLEEMGDTIICKTDAAQLIVNSDGLHYQWTPAASLNDATVQNPVAVSGNSDIYHVVATIGSCRAEKDITVTAIPYPVANAGPDSIICYNTPALLHGVHDGSTFSWTPISTLTNPATLNPVAHPVLPSTSYILTSFDTKGCPKPGRDTVVITQRPRIRAFAGRDTMVIVNQPLQFNAEGGIAYTWSPAMGLNDPNIQNPVGMYSAEIDSIRYMVKAFNDIGCYDSAFVKVTVFKTNPYVFVPSAFTPNGDGLNDIVWPTAVGVKQINYFRIFNRWGQMVFNTTANGKGWDGKINGASQGSNVYVWMVSAVDYLNKPIFLKGTVTLIR